MMAPRIEGYWIDTDPCTGELVATDGHGREAGRNVAGMITVPPWLPRRERRKVRRLLTPTHGSKTSR